MDAAFQHATCRIDGVLGSIFRLDLPSISCPNWRSQRCQQTSWLNHVTFPFSLVVIPPPRISLEPTLFVVSCLATIRASRSLLGFLFLVGGKVWGCIALPFAWIISGRSHAVSPICAGIGKMGARILRLVSS